MQLSAEITYPGADPVDVFTMISDQGFQEQRCAATGSVAYQVEIVRHDDGSLDVTTTRTLPTDEAPEFLRRFVGGSVRVIEHHHWSPAAGDGERTGTALLQIAGVPVTLRGALSLRAFGDGTIHDLDGDLKASVPLIGGRIERAVEPAIRAAALAEESTGRAWLAGESP